MRLAVCLAVGCCALAGCGGGGEDTQQAPVDAAAGDARLRQGTPQSRIRQTYKVFNRGLLDRDFGTVCARLAPESIDFMLRKFKRSGIAETSCEVALARVYKILPKEQVDTLDEAARTIRVRKIELHGSSAKVE